MFQNFLTKRRRKNRIRFDHCQLSCYLEDCFFSCGVCPRIRYPRHRMKPDVKYTHVLLNFLRNDFKMFNFWQILSGVLTKSWLNWKFMQMQPLQIMELPIGKWWHRSNQIRYYFSFFWNWPAFWLFFNFRRPRGTQLFSVILLTVLMPTTHTCSLATLPWTRVC